MSKDVLQAFGFRVRQLRFNRGLSQEQFAERCGLHRTYIGAIERGERNVSLLNIEKIAIALGVKIVDLFVDNMDD
jgi:transcriptional regulator with XRE-family HTH domain